MNNTTKSIYDKIETAKDLIREVKAHGLSTKTDDICRAQDIFGRSTIEELDALATDNKTHSTFYFTLFTIWNWEEATRFFNEHSNISYIEGRNAVKGARTLTEEIDKLEARIARQNGEIAEYKEAIKQHLDEKVEYQKEIDEKDALIIKLKARLFDLMVASGK